MTRKYNFSLKKKSITDYIFSVIVISVIVTFCYLLQPLIGYRSVSLILLVTITFLPLFFEAKPVLFSATLIALLWDFLFIPDKFTIYISTLEDALMFIMYFIIAIITGILTSRIRSQEKIARYREQRTKAVYNLTKQLIASANLDDVIKIAKKNIMDYFYADSFILISDNGKLVNKSDKFILNEKEFAIASWTFEKNKKAGKFTDILSASEYIYYPLPTARNVFGVIGININDVNFNHEQETLLETFVYQIASSIEREILNEKTKEIMLIKESERLYTTLLNSISHELKTPLSTIMWASKSLIDSVDNNDLETIKELDLEIYTASERLNRLVSNLLDMSRLESGKFSLNLKWNDINDLIFSVLKSLKDELELHIVNVEIEEDLPLIKIDFGLFEQALVNIIINSTIYTPPKTIIGIKVYQENKKINIEIKDNGPGLPKESIDKIFDKFYRVPGSKTGGTGLGLSIVKGFIEAHKGKISVKNNIDKGITFKIELPQSETKFLKLENE